MIIITAPRLTIPGMSLALALAKARRLGSKKILAGRSGYFVIR